MIPTGRILCALTFLVLPGAAWAQSSSDPPRNELRAMAEDALNGRLVDIPLGPMTVTHKAERAIHLASICGHDPLPLGSVVVIASAVRAGLVGLRMEEDSNRSTAGIIRDLGLAQMLVNRTRRIVVTATDAGRAVDVTAALPAGRRIANCIRVRQGKFSVTDLTIRPAHGRDGSQYRIVSAKYDAQWTPEYRAMGVDRTRYADAAVLGMLVHLDPADGRWERLDWTVRSATTREPLTFRVGRVVYY